MLCSLVLALASLFVTLSFQETRDILPLAICGRQHPFDLIALLSVTITQHRKGGSTNY